MEKNDQKRNAIDIKLLSVIITSEHPLLCFDQLPEEYKKSLSGIYSVTRRYETTYTVEISALFLIDSFIKLTMLPLLPTAKEETPCNK